MNQKRIGKTYSSTENSILNMDKGIEATKTIQWQETFIINLNFLYQLKLR